MREPEQSVLAVGCPGCQVLYPGAAAPCPRCGGAQRFLPAQMLDEPSIARAVQKAVDAYEPASRERLDRLLHVLFVHGPAARRALEADGRLTLDRLRADDGRLP